MQALLGRVAVAHGLRGERWLRHANPWSGWLRAFTGLPLLVAAVWSRQWLGLWWLLLLAVVVAWSLLNPHLFKPISRADGWMSQGVLGERVVVDGHNYSHHHRRVLRVLLSLALASTGVLAVGLVLLDPSLTLVGVTAAMILKFWFVDRCVWIYREVYPTNAEVQSWTDR